VLIYNSDAVYIRPSLGLFSELQFVAQAKNHGYRLNSLTSSIHIQCWWTSHCGKERNCFPDKTFW